MLTFIYLHCQAPPSMFCRGRYKNSGDWLIDWLIDWRGASRRFYDIRLQKMSWPWNMGQRSFKVIESGTIRKIVYGFLLGFFSNIVPKTHRFWDIRLQNCRDIENRVRGPSRSLEMSLFDRVHMTSYWRSIVTMALSSVVSEILNVGKYRDLEIPAKGQSRSSKVVPFDRLRMVFY